MSEQSPEPVTSPSAMDTRNESCPGKDELIKRARRIAGQVQAIERALEAGTSCARTLHLVAATRGAINGLFSEIIERHAREHVTKVNLSDQERAKGVDQLLDAVNRLALRR